MLDVPGIIYEITHLKVIGVGGRGDGGDARDATRWGGTERDGDPAPPHERVSPWPPFVIPWPRVGNLGTHPANLGPRLVIPGHPLMIAWPRLVNLGPRLAVLEPHLAILGPRLVILGHPLVNPWPRSASPRPRAAGPWPRRAHPGRPGSF